MSRTGVSRSKKTPQNVRYRRIPDHFHNLDAAMLDGQITIGKKLPIGNVAIATDGRNAIAMRRQRPGKAVLDPLQRLEVRQ